MTQAEYDELIEALRSDADQAAWFLGYLIAVITDSEVVSARLDGSVSGYAAVTARAGVKTSLILYCARAWDDSSDAISLIRAEKHLPALSALDEKRNRRLSGLQGPIGCETSLAAEYQRFDAEVATVRANPYHPHMRVLRTEYFAHRILSSRDRNRLTRNGVEMDEATYDDLIELAASTLSLVGKLGYLWDQLVDPYPDKIERATNCCREFWRVIPVLKDVERLEDGQ